MSDAQKNNINAEYLKFVLGVMSNQSKDLDAFIKNLSSINQQINVPMALTAAVGLSGEVGEFNDLIKKIVFMGKPVTPEIREKLISELSDVCWYLAAACMAVDTDLNTVIARNMEKLAARYPNGFSTERSENRVSENLASL